MALAQSPGLAPRPLLKAERQQRLQAERAPVQWPLPRRPSTHIRRLGAATATAALGLKALSSRRRRGRELGACSVLPERSFALVVGNESAPRPRESQVTALAAVPYETAGAEELVETSIALSAAFGLNTVPTLATLATAIFCHEGGHFLCAKSVNLPAVEFSIGFGPELLSTEQPVSEVPNDTCEFTDAEKDTVRLERFAGDVKVIVNGKQVWTGIPSLNQSNRALDCGGQGTCVVPEDLNGEVEAILQKATAVAAEEVEQPKDTIYSLRLLPIGGYVRFDDRKTVKLADGTMVTRLESMPILAQLWVYAGGVLTNVGVAFTALLVSALTVGVPDSKPLPGIRVEALGEDDVLRTGLRAKDVLLRIGDLDLHAPGQSVSATVDFIRQLPAMQPVSVLVERAGREIELNIVPLTDAKTGLQRLGVSIITNTERIFLKATGLLDAAGLATSTMQRQLDEQLTALKGLVSFSGTGDIVGPVGMIKQGSDLTEAEGLIGLAMFFVSINLNLALLNVLPVPALDGGKIAFALAGSIFGKPVDEEKKQAVESAFILLVLVGIASLTIKDVTKLFAP
mmetsp:Transcript_43336/g.119888  ORF Transcript_43336/g.119888 Transcript_43336/m.119888 type:complete len:570 (+) Transcript_43336:54-1763(+)